MCVYVRECETESDCSSDLRANLRYRSFLACVQAVQRNGRGFFSAEDRGVHLCLSLSLPSLTKRQRNA